MFTPISIIVTLLLQFTSVDSLSPPHDENWLTNDTCTIRFLMVNAVKQMTTCQSVLSKNLLCNRNVTVGYQQLPPYIYKNSTGHVVGILKMILEDILINSCCLGCNGITFEEVTSFNSSNYDILMPFENSIGATELHATPYANLIKFKEIQFIGKFIPKKGVALISSMFESLAKVWPIFVIAILMAICAGAIIWVFDTWTNKSNFPRQFIRGAFEGFWWAFVSMTTVGYGDRTPNSFFARIFAVLWILFGITLFNMFTAALTSAMTSTIVDEAVTTLNNEKVGVLGDMAAPFSAIAKQHSRPYFFNNIEGLAKALKNDEVKAIGLEAMMSFYYMEQIKKQYEETRVVEKIQIEHNGLGILSSNDQIMKMIRSFLDHNIDSIDVLFAKAAVLNQQLFVEDDPDEADSDDPDFTKVDKHFWYTIIIGVAVAFTCLIVGILLSVYKEKKKGNDITLKNLGTY